jgi:dihydroorotate dehydrogenase
MTWAGLGGSLGTALLRLLEPERAHALTLRLLRALPLRGAPEAADPILATRVWGLDFPNPVGLAAGFDKDAEVVDAAFGLGFGFVEVGSVTPRPQPGNPRPRVFRLAEDRSVINRYGFNSQGHEAVACRLEAWRTRGGRGVLGVNLGKNRDSADAAADYAACLERMAPLADYLVVNVSSPNTPGLRDLQDKAELSKLLARLRDRLEGMERHPPLLVKIAPDLDRQALGDIVTVARDGLLDGLIVSNTTTARPPGLRSHYRDQAGGLSGRALFEPSTALLRETYRLTEGGLPLIGVGGIASGADAYAKLRAGASLVQLYTALVYEGPALIGRIKRELAACLRRDGFASLGQAVGSDSRAS